MYNLLCTGFQQVMTATRRATSSPLRRPPSRELWVSHRHATFSTFCSRKRSPTKPHHKLVTCRQHHSRVSTSFAFLRPLYSAESLGTFSYVLNFILILQMNSIVITVILSCNILFFILLFGFILLYCLFIVLSYDVIFAVVYCLLSTYLCIMLL